MPAPPRGSQPHYGGPSPNSPGRALQRSSPPLCQLPLPQGLQLPCVLPVLGSRLPLPQPCQLLRALRAVPSAPRGGAPRGSLSPPPRLTWSRNMREMISRTCRAHCCSTWALARNLSRSSIPLMCSAHSTRSCTLASPSTPWGGTVGGGGDQQGYQGGLQGAGTAPDLLSALGKGLIPVPAPPWGPGGHAAHCAPAARSSRSAACPPPAAAPSPGAMEP